MTVLTHLAPSFPNDEHSEVYSGPVWMDDLCVTIQAETASAAVHKAGVVSSLLLETLFEHAMTPNLKRGKTELLFALRGPGVRKLKTQHFGPASSGSLTVITEHDTHQIAVVGEYVHLGGILHHGGDHRKEMRRRTAMAHQTFTAHRTHYFPEPLLAAAQKSPTLPVPRAESASLWQCFLVSTRSKIQRFAACLDHEALQKAPFAAP